MNIKKLSQEVSGDVRSTVIEATVDLSDDGLSPEIMGLMIYIDNPSDPYLVVENSGKYDAKVSVGDRYFVIANSGRMHTIDLGFPVTVTFEVLEDA